jgi:hypothetical protein
MFQDGEQISSGQLAKTEGSAEVLMPLRAGMRGKSVISSSLRRTAESGRARPR